MRLKINEVSLFYLEQTNFLLDGFIISYKIIDKTLNKYFKKAPIALFVCFFTYSNCRLTISNKLNNLVEG